jgi:putative mRNA 3-end processing factor
MIDSDFLAFNENGLYCKAGDFYLDPEKPVVNAVISHAHGDHARSGNVSVYCTPPTASIMQLRFKRDPAKRFYTFGWRESFEINGVKIEFVPAGHILGSAQVLMEFKGIRYLFTGDFKLQEDPTCEPFEYISADVLITETTFADPKITHPDPVSEIKKINAFAHNILLGAYSLGKSQRLISMIARYCPDKKVLVHHSILPLNKIYEQYAFSPGRYEPYNRKLMKEPGSSFVYIVPPLTFESYFRAKNVVRIFASGWKKLQAFNDLELYISDHGDWKDILHLIEMVEPKEVWTLHGKGEYLQNYLAGKLDVKIL